MDSNDVISKLNMFKGMKSNVNNQNAILSIMLVAAAATVLQTQNTKIQSRLQPVHTTTIAYLSLTQYVAEHLNKISALTIKMATQSNH